MRKILWILIVSMVAFQLIGCTTQNTTGELNDKGLTQEEQKRVDLYVTAMKASFHEENGGNKFIAVKLETLAELSDKGKLQVMDGLKDLSEHVYAFEEIKDDKTKFETDANGHLVRSFNGTLLYVDVEKYKGNSAIIRATSWFGNLGAVLPKYKATYKNGTWHLKVIEFAIS